MGWATVMGNLEQKLVGTLEGRYRPRDGVPFFRVQYPPAEEREALRQFRLLGERLRQKGWDVRVVRLTEALWEALEELLGCGRDMLLQELVSLETLRDRVELQRLLAEHLPRVCADVVVRRLENARKGSVALLVRTGALYPFVRPSTLTSLLEGRVPCAIVLAYPTNTIGALLDTSPAGGQGGYYRGEIVRWQGNF